MKTEHDSFLAYYLTQDDESALQFKETRASLQPYEVPEDEQVNKCSLPQFIIDLESWHRKPYSTS
jgi:RNA polymerase II-associated factor 1